eukprot:gene1710-2055_t
MLQHLPASHLTRLTFHFDNVPEEGAAAEALMRLTALQDLDLSSSFYLSEDFMLAVAGLANLVKLELPPLCMVGALCVDWLPPQLQQLYLHDFGRFDEECLQLGQLTALTRLQLGYRMYETSELLLCSGDILPPNLVILDAHLGSLQPVLQLQHLQQLNLTMLLSFNGEVELQALTQLQALTHVGLDYVQHHVHADVWTWPSLPVKQLALAAVHETTLHSLSQLQGLTSLQLGTSMRRKPCQVHASYGRLAEALQHLTALQNLWWKDVAVGISHHGSSRSDDGEPPRESEGDGTDSVVGQMAGPSDPGWALMRAVAIHPLRSVTFIGPMPGYERCAITALQAATGLTYLELCRCGVQDDDVILLAQHLTALQSLTVQRESAVSSAVLPAVCSSLMQLTALDLSRTNVSDEHLHYLTGLQSLCVLDLDETCVTDSGAAVQLSGLSQLLVLSVSRRRGSRAKAVS